MHACIDCLYMCIRPTYFSCLLSPGPRPPLFPRPPEEDAIDTLNGPLSGHIAGGQALVVSHTLP